MSSKKSLMRSGKEDKPPLISKYSCFLLSFILGAAVYEFKVFPSQYLERSFLGARSLYIKYITYPRFTGYHPRTWTKTGRADTGVTIHDLANSFDGLTLYTSGHASKAFLVAMDGRVVHEWSLPFREAWPDPPHIDDPVDDEFIYWRMAHLFPNGDLLAIYVAAGDTPWGYGLVKIDKDSKIIWKYAGRAHHDLDVTEDGKIYTLVHPISNEDIPGIPGVGPPFLHDALVILSPDGEELKRISIFEALRDSEYDNILRLINKNDMKRDFLHSNAVEIVRQTIDKGDAVLEQGQALVSMRSVETIVAIDPKNEKVTWALKGPWGGQHDLDLLDNGHMMIFDNYGYIGRGGMSRIIEFDPFTQEVYWDYTGDADAYFYSRIRSRQQRLPNGNTLITESDTGRLFEVTPDRKIVWEYFNPNRGGENNDFVAVIMAAVRYSMATLTFLANKVSDASRPETEG